MEAFEAFLALGRKQYQTVLEASRVEPHVARYAIACTGIALCAWLLREVPYMIIGCIRYIRFANSNIAFYKAAPGQKYRTLDVQLPIPLAPAKQSYVMDIPQMRTLLKGGKDFDVVTVQKFLHHMGWGVPLWDFREEVLLGAKELGKALARPKLGPLMARFESKLLEELDSAREAIGSEGRYIPLQRWGFGLLFEPSNYALYGPDLGPTRILREQAQRLAENIHWLVLCTFLPILPFWWWVSIIPGARLCRNTRLETEEILHEWLQSGKSSSASEAFQSVMKVLEDEKVPSRIQTQYANVMWWATFGNTGETIGWFLSYSLQSPAYMRELMKQLDALPAGSLAEVDLKKSAPLLNSGIQETLRLATAGFSGRIAKQDTVLPGLNGVTFKKGTWIRTMTRAAVFSAKDWGEDAEYWKGSRFHDAQGSLDQNQMMFGGGVSACPGRWFSLHELQTILAHVLRSFNFEVGTMHTTSRLPVTAGDYDLGKKVSTSPTCKILDLDGTVLEGVYPGVRDRCWEGINGVLLPNTEPTMLVNLRV